MINFKFWFSLAIVTAVVFVAPIPGHSEIQRIEASRYALIVEADDPDAGTKLGETLGKAYGFNVHLLTGEEATRERIRREMNILYEKIQEHDELFVHLSMPVTRIETLFFIPKKGDPSAPWTLLTSEYVLEWISALLAAKTLITYPACAVDTMVRQKRSWSTLYPEFHIFQKLRVYGSVEFLMVCWPNPIRKVPCMWSSGKVTHKLNEVLEKSIGDLKGLTGKELALKLSNQLPDLRFNVQDIGNSRQPALRIVAGGTFADYREHYQVAVTTRELKQVINDFAVASRHDRQLQPSLVAFLRDIATDRNAKAAKANLKISEILQLRSLAVDYLGRPMQVDSSVARDALIHVSSESNDSPFIRQLAISRLSRYQDLRPEDFKALWAALSDMDSKVRETAARSLGITKDKASAPLLTEMIVSESDKSAKLAAMQALSGLRIPESRRLFASELNNNDPDIRSGAADALAELGVSDFSTKALLERMSIESDISVKRSLVFAIGRASAGQPAPKVINTPIERKIKLLS